MKIRIAGQEISRWQNLTVTLLYDSVKSTFSFDIWWDPWDANTRGMMLPGAYLPCTIVSDNGKTLLTGIMHCPSFEDSATPTLVNMSGCSITGVLDDVEYSSLRCYSQNNGKTVLQITQAICNEFGIGLVDKTNGAANAVVTLSDDERSDTCTDYLSYITKESNIVLSHDANGNLVLAVAQEKKPVFDFAAGMPGVKFNLTFDGANMHSKIIAAAQGGKSQTVEVFNPYVPSKGIWNFRSAAINNGNILNAPAGQLSIINEFNTGYRPRSVTQKDTDPDNLQKVAEQALADELRAITMGITIDNWELANEIVLPSDIVTVLSPRCYLFIKTKFFVQGVTFRGSASDTVATLSCYVPEVFNGKKPINIFLSQGNSTNFKAGPDNPEPLKEQPQAHIILL